MGLMLLLVKLKTLILLWTKLKIPFMEKEKAIEILLVDKDKLNILVEGIKKY